MGISPLPRGGGGNPSENPTTNLPIIAAGGSHTLAIIDGELWSWGSNSSAQLGFDSGGARATPTKIGDQTNWVNIAAGSEHSLAINSDGELWAWGSNRYGQIGLGDTISRSGLHMVGTKANWINIAAGSEHSLAINSDGELWAWGYNEFGQLGIGSSGSTASRNTLTRVGDQTNWVSVSAGRYHSLATNINGELFSWGHNSSGQLGLGYVNTEYPYAGAIIPTRVGTETNWVNISAGYLYSMSMNSDGELWSWGSNSSAQLGLGDTTTRTVPARVGTEANWVSISAGGNRCLAINELGELYSWGNNVSGQLGLGDSGYGTNRTTPTRVGDHDNWHSITAGASHSIAVNSDGELWAWGYNEHGQLGLGGSVTEASDVPTIIFGSNVVAPSIEYTTGYNISAPSATRVKIGGSYTFTITTNPNYTAPIVKINTSNGKVNLSSIDNNVYTYTISNVVGDIVANNFTVSVSRVK